MQNPEQEARQVVRSLCQGTVDEQRRTLDRYFSPDFSFVHPFCAVPPFAERQVPVLGFRLGSRDVVRAIFQWYRMLSPKIEIEIDSVLHDKARDKLYLDIRQTFSVWFIPAYHAHVRLVTVLDLIPTDDMYDKTNNHTDHRLTSLHEPLDRLLTSKESKYHHHHQQQHHHHQQHDPTANRRRWLITRQEDLYQVNEFLRFAGPTPLPLFWFFFQLGATAICVFMALFVRLSPWAWGQKNPAEGGVEALIEVRDEEGKKEEDRGPASKTREYLTNGDRDRDHDHDHDDVDQEQNGHAKHGGSGKNGTGSGGGDADGATNGHRRNSSTHSQHHHQPPKKSWKNGGSAKKH